MQFAVIFAGSFPWCFRSFQPCNSLCAPTSKLSNLCSPAKNCANINIKSKFAALGIASVGLGGKSRKLKVSKEIYKIEGWTLSKVARGSFSMNLSLYIASLIEN